MDVGVYTVDARFEVPHTSWRLRKSTQQVSPPSQE